MRARNRGSPLPTLDAIRAAAELIGPYVHRTPLYLSATLSHELGAEIFLKLECYQPIRVFKIRGALNKLLRLSAGERDRGVITASSGNHGLAVAYGADLLGVSAVICVPEQANPDKLRAIADYGAEVVRYGRIYDETYRQALRLQQARGLTFVHAFDDPVVIAGQGTIGLEIVDDLPAVDTVVVPVGGGGLIAGIATAVKALRPQARIVGVQSERVPSMYRSWQAGKRVEVEDQATIADGLAARQPGQLTFELCRRYVDEIRLVSDAQLRLGILELIEKQHIFAEPAGAAPWAALRDGYPIRSNEKVALVISGGNIATDLLAELLHKSAGGTAHE